MAIKLNVRGFIMGAAVLAMAAWATPALAQGSIKGRVLDDKKHPVSGVQVSVACTSVKNVQGQGVTTDSDGRFQFTGLVFGQWTLVAQQGKMIAKPKEASLNVMPNIVTDVGDIMLKLDESAPAIRTTAPAAGMSSEEAKAHNEAQAALQAKFKGANDDIAAGRFDDAIAKLNAVAKDVSKDKDKKNSASVSAKLGETYMRKNEADTTEDSKKEDMASAEKFFLEAISFEPDTLDAYKALASIYNTQQKFDDAIKMNAKVTELTAATGGNQDPTALYNEGVVLWNAQKIEEAEAAFKKASTLNPKMASAFFQLGMAEVNLNKIPEAIAAFEKYLTLEPKGENAETAKAMLVAIKK